MEHILIQMEPSTKGIGKRINRMALEKKPGLTELVIKEITDREGSRVKVNLNGLMAQSMKDTSLKIIYMEKVNIKSNF